MKVFLCILLINSCRYTLESDSTFTLLPHAVLWLSHFQEKEDWDNFRNSHGRKEKFCFISGGTAHLPDFSCYLWLGTCNCSSAAEGRRCGGRALAICSPGTPLQVLIWEDIRAQIPEEVWRESGEIILSTCLLLEETHKLSEIPERKISERTATLSSCADKNCNVVNYMAKNNIE